MSSDHSALDLLQEGEGLLRRAMAHLPAEDPGGDPATNALADLVAAVEATQHALFEILDPFPESTPLGDYEGPDVPSYAAMVRAVRTAVREATPHGARVLVVSKGDPELVALDGRYGRHFPADTLGQWAGFAPASSAQATALLNEAMTSGVDYFVLPDIYRWWTGYYAEFFEHLRTAGSVVRDDADGLIVDLRATKPAPGCPVTASRGARRAQLVQFVDALLPTGAAVLVLDERGGEPAIGSRPAGLLAAPDDENDECLVTDLCAAIGDGWRYLVIPADLRDRADGWTAFGVILRRKARLVGAQHRSAYVFELSPPEGTS